MKADQGFSRAGQKGGMIFEVDWGKEEKWSQRIRSVFMISSGNGLGQLT